MFKKRLLIPVYIVLSYIFLISIIFVLYKIGSVGVKDKGSYDNSKKTAVFHGKEFTVPEEIVKPSLSYEDVNIDFESQVLDVLGSESKDKRIEVNLTDQKLYAYEGDKKKMSFDVSTGKWGLTPTGEFQIWSKLKYTLMTGGSQEYGTYYYLPNVPYTMYFYRDFGIHGAYWHDNFGHPMSHGCVNMRIEDAEKLFYWANPKVPDNLNSISSTNDNPGTKVVIYGTTPNE